MTNPSYEFAKLFKERENPTLHGLTEGVVEQLPVLKIRVDDTLVLDADMIGSLVNLYAQDEDGQYLWVMRKVYLLPFPEDAHGGIQKYLVLGGDELAG